jgi:hypothetical protein
LLFSISGPTARTMSSKLSKSYAPPDVLYHHCRHHHRRCFSDNH